MRQFTIELEELNEKLLQMGGMVESAIHRSVRALLEKDRELAEEVIRD
jgi:phosphate transport system protein